MQPDVKDAAYLWDIVEAALHTQAFTEGMNRSDFESDPKTYFAVIAQLQVIGEATKRLSEEFRNGHPALPWSDMARMRDWLIHHYDRIKLEVVWDTVTKDVPQVIAFLQPMLPAKRPEKE